MKHRAVALLGLTLFLFACKHADAPPPAESPAPAPPTLVAEATIRNPDALWGAFRKGGGDALGMFPDTAAGVIIARAKLEARFARLVSGSAPLQIALGESQAGGVAFGIAMKLRDARAAEETLTKGEAGRYVGKPVHGMTALALRSDEPLPLAVALTPAGYLVLATTEEDLGTFGAYAARTLLAKPAPSSAVEVRFAAAAIAQAAAKAPSLAASLTSLALRAAGGALPAWFDANAFSTCTYPMVSGELALVGDLAEARIDLDPGNGELHAVATLTPKASDNAARARFLSMHPGDASPLLDTPRDSPLAWFVSDTPAERADVGSSIGRCFEHAFAAALGTEGHEKLSRSMAAWGKGRGDWETVALVSSPPQRGMAVRAPVVDADAVGASLRDLVDVLAAPPSGEVLQQTFGVRTGVLQQVEVAPFGKTMLFSFAPSSSVVPRGGRSRAAALAEGPPPPLGLAWAVGAREIDVSLGFAPKEILGGVGQPPTLATDGPASRAVRALAEDATFAAVVRPPGCCRTGTATAAPITFGWGTKGQLGWMRLEVGYEILANLASSNLAK